MASTQPALRTEWEAELTRSLPPHADVRALAAEISRIAAAYPPEASETARRARDRFFRPVQRLAWELRFGTPESAAGTLTAVVDQYL